MSEYFRKLQYVYTEKESERQRVRRGREQGVHLRGSIDKYKQRKLIYGRSNFAK